MKNIQLIALSAALFGGAVAAPAVAQDDPQAQPATDENIHVEGTSETEEPNSADDEVVCRREEPPVGSRLRARRTCMTRAQWQRLEDDTRRFLREGRDSTGGAPNYPVTR